MNPNAQLDKSDFLPLALLCFMQFLVVFCSAGMTLSDVSTQTQTSFFREPSIFSAAKAASEFELGNFRILFVGGSLEEIASFWMYVSETQVDTKKMQIAVLNSDAAELSRLRTGKFWIFEEFFEQDSIYHSAFQKGIIAEESPRTRSSFNYRLEKKNMVHLKISDSLRTHTELIEGDVRVINLSAWSSQFNLVIINNVLMHYPENERMVILERLIDLLVPGGSIDFEQGEFFAPSDRMIYEQWFRDSAKFNQLGVQRIYPYPALTKALIKSPCRSLLSDY